MKVRFGIPKTNAEYEKELIHKQWTSLKEPRSVGKATLLSVPIMLLNLFISLIVLNYTSGISLEEFGITETEITITLKGSHLLWLFGLIVIHELIHLVLVPNFIKSKKTYIGLTWQAGFVLTEDVISKSRFLVISLAPFVIISIILPVILSWFGLMIPLIKGLVIFNAIASAVDLLNVVIVMKQVPKNGRLVNNGLKTYWKAA